MITGNNCSAQYNIHITASKLSETDNVITMSGIRYHGKISKATREHDNLHVVGYKSSSGVTHIPFLIFLFDLSRTVLLTRG